MTARPLPSIRARLTKVLVLAALGWGLLMSAAVWLTVRDEVGELLDETLHQSAEVLGRLLSVGDTAFQQAAGHAFDDVRPDHEQFAWQLLGGNGQVLLRSARAPVGPWLPSPNAPPASGRHSARNTSTP